ncbi:MAG: 2-amino-4-hydroxy-6-hydroxymethyldihydropteridine diphosphokinase, partial [Chromatiaceae bacterium]
MTAVLRSSSVTAYIALGSNLADPERQVRDAVSELATLPGSTLGVCSALYQTAPVGPPGQPDYINAAVRLDTRLPPRALLGELQAIELRHGRQRDGTRWGPRTLDLDILIYGDEQVDELGLTIPHPELPRRAFVLAPLADVASRDMLVPGMGNLAALLEQCPLEGI